MINVKAATQNQIHGDHLSYIINYHKYLTSTAFLLQCIAHILQKSKQHNKACAYD